MSVSAPWREVLTSPAPGQHVAQLYTEPGFLVRAVGEFAGQGLRQGDAVVVCATALHWQALAPRLTDDGAALDALRRSGQLVVLDAAECLAAILVEGMPDPARFQSVIGGPVERAKAAGYRRVRAFGEMVDLLRHTSLAGVLRLEELWGEALRRHGISLLCAYSLDTFDPRIYHGLLQRVSEMHSDLVPVEDYARLESAVERAYADVFGPVGDPGPLRGALLAHYVRPAAMPDGAAAILALGELLPTASGALLERVRHHYRSMSASPDGETDLTEGHR